MRKSCCGKVLLGIFILTAFCHGSYEVNTQKPSILEDFSDLFLSVFQWVDSLVSLIFPTTTEDNCQNEVELLKNRLSDLFQTDGYEVSVFLVGWYNNYIIKEGIPNYFSYLLPYPEDTVAFNFLSNKLWYDKFFIPFVEKNKGNMSENLANLWKIKEGVNKLHENFSDSTFFGDCGDVIHFSKSAVVGNKEQQAYKFQNPKYLLVQRAGDVSGNVRYYTKLDLKTCNNSKYVVNSDFWNKTCGSSYGTALHPIYGGWFQFRGALVLPSLRCNMKMPLEINILPNCDKIGEFLCLANRAFTVKNKTERNSWRNFAQNGKIPLDKYVYTKTDQLYSEDCNCICKKY